MISFFKSVNQQYRVDERADESGDAGVHSPAVDSIQQDEPINLYDDIDSDDLDIVEKKAEPIGVTILHKSLSFQKVIATGTVLFGILFQKQNVLFFRNSTVVLW